MFARIGRMVRAVQVPVTADIEPGTGLARRMPPEQRAN